MSHLSIFQLPVCFIILDPRKLRPFYVMQPKFGGMIIDIVSRDVKTPEQQMESIIAVRNAVVVILVIVVIGYIHLQNTSLFSFDLEGFGFV